jgi:hypothetical protein
MVTNIGDEVNGYSIRRSSNLGVSFQDVEGLFGFEVTAYNYGNADITGPGREFIMYRED